MDKDRIRASIKKQLAELETTIKSLKDSLTPVSPDSAIGRLTRMEAIQAQSVATSSLKRAEKEKILLNHALNRINEPEFGYCIECGDELPQKRLCLMPYAIKCMACLSTEDD